MVVLRVVAKERTDETAERCHGTLGAANGVERGGHKRTRNTPATPRGQHERVSKVEVPACPNVGKDRYRFTAPDRFELG